jgi:uncharacterized membrane protein YbaN (DUF454 family)
MIMAKMMRQSLSWIRPIYFGLGLVFVALGYIGLILPVMPGTIFFILALNCFRRSNAKLEYWLLHKTPMGPTLRQWDETGAIKPKTKKVIIFLLVGSICGSVYQAFKHYPGTNAILISVALVATAAAVTTYIATRPNA